MYKYLIEYVGTLVILTAMILTEVEPIILGLVYFSVFFMTKGLSNGYFTPLGPLVIMLLGRGEMMDMIYNVVAQILAAVSVWILFKPITIFIEQI